MGEYTASLSKEPATLTFTRNGRIVQRLELDGDAIRMIRTPIRVIKITERTDARIRNSAV